MSDLWGQILYRTPYMVMPRLAIESMPLEWQERLHALIEEANDTGMETPEYYVFRNLTYCDMKSNDILGVVDVQKDMTRKPFYRFAGRRADPWADYRHGNVERLCEGFKTGEQNGL